MKIKIWITIILLLLISLAAWSTNEPTIDEHHAKCTGSKSCRACKNCEYCKHCSENGGSCGVCKP